MLDYKITQEQIAHLRETIYADSKRAGWHTDDYGEVEWAASVLSEIGEVINADRTYANANMFAFDDAEDNIGDFKFRFSRFIKDTLEDELADVAICFLDYPISIDEEEISFPGWEVAMSMAAAYVDCGIPELCLTLARCITHCVRRAEDDVRPEDMGFDGHSWGMLLPILMRWCLYNDIDIMRHIDMKIEYNKLRPYRHGGNKY